MTRRPDPRPRSRSMIRHQVAAACFPLTPPVVHAAAKTVFPSIRRLGFLPPRSALADRLEHARPRRPRPADFLRSTERRALKSP